MSSRFVVTGCGRSGTTFTTEVMNRLGIRTVHEQYFPTLRSILGMVHYNRRTRPFISFGRIGWHAPPWGEVAWQAAPSLDRLQRDIVIFHQLRHPFCFAASRIRKGLTYVSLRKRNTRFEWPCGSKDEFSSLPTGIQVELLLRFWLEWNELVERKAPSAFQFRIEDFGSDLVAAMLARIGVHRSRAQIEEVIAEVPPTVNTRGSTTLHAVREKLPEDLLSKLVDAADRYGYSLDALDSLTGGVAAK